MSKHACPERFANRIEAALERDIFVARDYLVRQSRHDPADGHVLALRSELQPQTRVLCAQDGGVPAAGVPATNPCERDEPR